MTRALQHLEHQVAEPVKLAAVELRTGQIVTQLATPTALPSPWRGTPDQRRWTLQTRSQTMVVDEAVDTSDAPSACNSWLPFVFPSTGPIASSKRVTLIGDAAHAMPPNGRRRRQYRHVYFTRPPGRG